MQYPISCDLLFTQPQRHAIFKLGSCMRNTRILPRRSDFEGGGGGKLRGRSSAPGRFTNVKNEGRKDIPMRINA